MIEVSGSGGTSHHRQRGEVPASRQSHTHLAGIQSCLGYLKADRAHNPDVIVTLGTTPLRELLGVQTGITKVRGSWQRLESHRAIPVMPTFHPAYVLRQYTHEVRGAVWADLKAARAWLAEHP